MEIQIFFDHWRRTVALFVQRNNSLAASICSQSLRIAAQTFSLFSENLHAWITLIKFQCGFANMIRARSSKQNEVTLGTTREEFLLRRENLTTGEMMVRGQQGEQQREPHATSSQVHVFIDVTSFFFRTNFDRGLFVDPDCCTRHSSCIRFCAIVYWRPQGAHGT